MQCSAKALEKWGQMAHSTEKYGDICNFSVVIFVILPFMNLKFVGTWAPTAKIIWDIPVFSVLNVLKMQPQHNPAMKWKCHHFGEVFNTGCTRSCQRNKYQCSQWQKFHQNDDISISLLNCYWYLPMPRQNGCHVICEHSVTIPLVNHRKGQNEILIHGKIVSEVGCSISCYL